MPDGSTTAPTTYDLVVASGPRLIEATHAPTGLRSRFEAVAPLEEGRGWRMRDVDGKVDGIVLDTDLTDGVALCDTRAQVAAQKRWSARPAGGSDAV